MRLLQGFRKKGTLFCKTRIRICEEELQPPCSSFDHCISTEDFGAKKWKERTQILVTLLELQHQALLRQE